MEKSKTGISGSHKESLSYKGSGVDIDAGANLVEKIKAVTERTNRPEVLSNLGGFGAMCEIPEGYHQPVLVSATDGVGTKLKLAMMLEKHDTIGIDLVAMCVNDLIVCGAEPLFFLDYYATGALNVDIANKVITGIGKGCELAGCALVGGETAEMPGMYNGEDYDLAGFSVGVVEKSKIIDNSKVTAGDLLIEIASSGPHSNGYSLVRYLLKQKKIDIKKNIFLKKELIKPTKIYVNEVLKLIDKNLINGCANITGGGLADNIQRVIPDNFTAEINLDLIKTSKIFKWLHKKGISDKEMLKTFNCGVGFCLIINPKKLNQIKSYFTNNYKPYVIGKITKNFKEKVKLNGSVNWI